MSDRKARWGGARRRAWGLLAFGALGCGADGWVLDSEAGVPPGALGDDPRPAAEGFVTLVPPRTAPPCRPDQYYVGRITGTLLDYTGRPVPEAQVALCGTACIPGETDRSGRFDVRADACFGTSSEYAHGMALSYSGFDLRPDVYFDFNPDDVRHMGEVHFNRPFYLSSFGPGGRVAAPPRVTQAVQLANDRGFALTVVPSTIEYPLSSTDEVVRVVQIPLSKLPPYTGPSPVVMYAISPADATLRVPAPVEFPNTLGLAPGVEVEIVAVGNHASAGMPPVGVLGPIDVGRVSPDGRRVVARSGLRFFGTVGYRTRPR